MGADHPVLVNDRYVTAPSPIPRFDNPKMMRSEALILLGAGREKKIYAIPPYTRSYRWTLMIIPSRPRIFRGNAAGCAGHLMSIWMKSSMKQMAGSAISAMIPASVWNA